MTDSITQTIRSDNLVSLRGLFGGDNAYFSAFSAIAKIFQIDLILDANIIIEEVRWLAVKRKNPDAGTRLLEVLKCETVKAFAPEFLIVEVEKHLPKIAKDDSVSLDLLTEHWEEYRSYITFVTVDVATEEEIALAQDPKDLPYIQLQNKIGAGIYSKDSDIEAMNGRVIGLHVIASLRKYSRNAAVEYQLKCMGLMSMTVTAHVFMGAVELIKALTVKTKTLPSWVLWFGALLVVVALIHPTSRAMTENWIKSLPDKIETFGVTLLEAIIPLIEEHNIAKEGAQNALSDVP